MMEVGILEEPGDENILSKYTDYKWSMAIKYCSYRTLNRFLTRKFALICGSKNSFRGNKEIEVPEKTKTSGI
jgi:hypothetical protein